MADIKISQLTAKAAKVESTDRIPIADFNGTTYDTKYVTGAQINELSLDTSPQLGGNLDVNGFQITSDSDQDVIINPNGVGTTKIESNLVLRDSAGATAKEILFYEGFSNGTNYVGLKAADSLTANTTYTLPTADGTSGQVLQTNGTGTLSWTNNDSGLTVNSTAITSGTAGRIFFQNASNQLSQSANLFWDNTNNRLGINKASPTVALDVTGSVAISSSITATSDGHRFGFFQILTSGNAGVTGQGITCTGFDSSVQLQGSKTPTDMFLFRCQEGQSTTSSLTNSDRSFIRTYGGFSDGNLNNLTANYLLLTPTYNFIGTRTGIITRGLYYNPTLTSMVNVTHRAIETTTGSVIFNSTSGNVAIGGTSFGTSSDKVLAQYTGTAPGSSPADAYQQYSADITAGNAAPHFRTENGNVVKLYQQSSAGITTVSDLVTILQNLGLLS